MKKDGLAVEGEGVLVQGRRVSPIIAERRNSILVWIFLAFFDSSILSLELSNRSSGAAYAGYDKCFR